MPRLILLVAVWPGVAAAQIAGPPNIPQGRAPQSYRIEVARGPSDIRERIRDGRRSGQLSRTDARRARREAGQIDTLSERYGAGGLSDAEARELQTRALVLQDQVDSRRTQGFGKGGAGRRGR